MFSISASLLLALFTSKALCGCSAPTPTNPPPQYDVASQVVLQDAFAEIQAELDQFIANDIYERSSYSIEVTSSSQTLWSSFHTADEKNDTRPGAKVVNGQSTYRIASITKAFTVLGLLQQHAAGNLSLDDTVDKYIEEFRQSNAGVLPWKDITLRTLASQLSGIPRDFSQGDLLAHLPNNLSLGLPPVSNPNLPKCDSLNNYIPCDRNDLLNTLRIMRPTYAPNQKSTYSNIAFELIGIVLSNVTGVSYEEYITDSILKPLGMNNTSFTKPSDSVAVLPKGMSWYWDVDEGIQAPTGGLFSTSSDLSIFLRYVLNHHNALTPSLNWLQPASYTSGSSAYGMPWEIYHSNRLLTGPGARHVTIFTKGGGLPGYITTIMVIPDFELGITILTSSSSPLATRKLLNSLLEIVTVRVLQAADSLAANQTIIRYVGTYAADKSSGLNSSLTLDYTPYKGLHPTRWISNGTDMLKTLPLVLGSIPQDPDDDNDEIDYAAWTNTANSFLSHFQLVPTLLYSDEINKRGAIWRGVPILNPDEDDFGAWSDFCITEVDGLRYAGQPLGEAIFWERHGAQGVAKAQTVELSAFRIKLHRVDDKDDMEYAIPELRVQNPA